MAASPPPEESPKLGVSATMAGLAFVFAILCGFAAATAVSYEDTSHSDDGYSDSNSEDDHADE